MMGRLALFSAIATPIVIGLNSTVVHHHAPEGHCEIGCADVKHYIGQGITGTQGMTVSVALRPEKIKLTREAPADVGFNAVRGTVREMSYFGSFTVFHLTLASGASLKVSQVNIERHPTAPLTWGDEAWAQWDAWSQVVLTQ